jgi:hypothetical protein
MARRFDSISGGLVDTIVASVGSSVSETVQSAVSGKQASFSINSVLGGAVQASSGYALNAGQNYILNQLGSSLGNTQFGELSTSIVTQVAAAGLSQATSFISQALPNPFIGGGGSNVTTAGLATIASKSSISIPDSVASKLEDADYGGIAYTVQDITFTLTPAKPGAQAQQPPQTNPTIGWDSAFSADALSSLPAVDVFKGSLALSGPAKGFNLGGRNYGAIFGNGNQLGPATSGFTSRIDPLF